MNSWNKNSTKIRGSFFIMTEILEIAKKGASKTRIMYGANLCFQQANEYLKFMLEVNLLEESIENSKQLYKTTEKGVNFLERSYALVKLLETEDDNKNDLRMPPLQLLRIAC